MPGNENELAFHEALRAEARQLYEDSLNPRDRALDWREAVLEARNVIKECLRGSKHLTDVTGLLQESGSHMLVLRHLMAPPVSQDQFKLICKPWPKSSEKSGAGLGFDIAAQVAESFAAWRSQSLAPWLSFGRDPKRREVERLLTAISPLIASQRVATARRNRLAYQQEQDLMERLEQLGWVKLKSRTIDSQAALAPKEFMHKARFASGRSERAEVDIALGLPNTIVLAMECKVTNDETNSVKRINDVVKKADAWKDHWGNFVRPAALLQGVVKLPDIRRLLEKDVKVFWSHRLDLFEAWLNEQM